jgi:hypothetical protein
VPAPVELDILAEAHGIAGPDRIAEGLAGRMGG